MQLSGYFFELFNGVMSIEVQIIQYISLIRLAPGVNVIKPFSSIIYATFRIFL
jgi:hypothetical protein